MGKIFVVVVDVIAVVFCLFVCFWPVKVLIKIGLSRLFETDFIRGQMPASTACDEE